MMFNPDEYARDLRRASELKPGDSNGIKATLATMALLDRYLVPWDTAEHIRMKIARAIVQRRISPRKVAELFDTAITRHAIPKGREYHVPNRGGFVCKSIFNEIERNSGEDRR